MVVINKKIIFNFTNFCVIDILTKLLALGILFSTAVRAVVVAKLVILGILFFKPYFSIKSSISSYVCNIRYFIFNTFYLSILYIFLTTSFFAASISLLKSTGEGANLSTSSLSTLFFKLLKLAGTFSIYQCLIYLHEILILMHQHLLHFLNLLLLHN